MEEREQEDLNRRLINRALEGNVEEAKQTISQGADVNTRNNNVMRSTVLQCAARGRLDFVNMLLDMGADINATDMDGDGALYYAMARKETDIVTLLIRRGADMERVNDTGKTLLEIFDKPEYSEVAGILKDAIAQKREEACRLRNISKLDRILKKKR